MGLHGTTIGSRCINHAWSLQMASQYFPLTIALSEGQLDDLRWRWGSSGIYSAKSAYQILASGGRVKWEFNHTWSFAIPKTVNIFIFLLLKDKLLTREVLIRRRFTPPDSSCPLCHSGLMETALHLFFQCQHSQRIWNKVAQLLNCNILVQGTSVQQIWRRCSRLLRHSAVLEKKWQCVFSSVCWCIWRQRNGMVFEEKKDPVDVVAQWIVRQATLWEKWCNINKNNTRLT